MRIDGFGFKKCRDYGLLLQIEWIGGFRKYGGTRSSCEYLPGLRTLSALKAGLRIPSKEVRMIDHWSGRVVILLFDPVYFFFQTRLNCLDSCLAFSLGQCDPYLYSLYESNLRMLSISTGLLMNFHTKLNGKSVLKEMNGHNGGAVFN